MNRMEQLLAFCDWERRHKPHPTGAPHVADWAAEEIERLNSALIAALKSKQTDAERLEKAEELLSRCADGFGAYIHGRKLKRQQRDRLREDIEQFLGNCHVRTIQPERYVFSANRSHRG
jgi:hypothetical protein